MQPEHWQRIESIFAGAAQRPADERAIYLDSRCGDDPELRSEVERLLEADVQAGTFIEDAVEQNATTLAGDVEELRTGSLIGSAAA